MEDKQIDLEKAKSWFVLAQMSIILAGFIFAIVGIAYTNSLNSLNLGIDSFKIAEQNCLNNNTQFLCNSSIDITNKSIELIKPQINLLMTSFWFGWIFVFISIILWIWGYTRIKKLKLLRRV